MNDISVIIPAKNRATTLPACLESILSQTYHPAEIIVIDDASSDNTRDVVEKYSSERVKYARLDTGRGAQAARNMGIRLAKGAWIAFQDSDDLWLPNRLEVQIIEINRRITDADKLFLHGNGQCLVQDTKEISPLAIRTFEGNAYNELLKYSGPMFQSFLVRKSTLEKIGLLDENCPSFQEWDTAIRLSRVSELVHLKQPIFYWVSHSGETISKNKARHISGYQYVIEKHKHEIISALGDSVWLKHVIANIINCLNWGLFDESLKLCEREKSNVLPLKILKIASRLRTRPQWLIKTFSYIFRI